MILKSSQLWEDFKTILWDIQDLLLATEASTEEKVQQARKRLSETAKQMEKALKEKV